MKITVQIFVIAFVFFLLPSKANAQASLVNSGGYTGNSTGEVSYTIGQTAFSYFEGTSGSVSQGVQQPYEIFLITDAEKAWGVILDCLVFPNPVQENLQLKIQGLKWEKLRWRVYDLSGKLLKEDKVSQSLSTIPLDELKSGSYLFSVFGTKNSKIKTFKIIKN